MKQLTTILFCFIVCSCTTQKRQTKIIEYPPEPPSISFSVTKGIPEAITQPQNHYWAHLTWTCGGANHWLMQTKVYGTTNLHNWYCVSTQQCAPVGNLWLSNRPSSEFYYATNVF